MGGPWLDSRCPTRPRYHFPFLPGQRRKNKTENNLWVETSQSKRFNVEKQRKMLKTLFFTSYQQAVLCYFPESNGSAWVAFPLEGKTYKKWMPSFISPFIDFKCEQTSYGMEYPFGQLGSPVLALSPPKILPTPILLVVL